LLENMTPPEMRSRIRRRAFTLVEMIMVVMVIGILAAVAAPRFHRGLLHQRSLRAAQRVGHDLRWARQRALTTSTPQRVVFTVASSSYALAGVPHPDRPAISYQVDLRQPPLEANLSAADFGGDAEVVFDVHGVPDSGGTVQIQVGPFTQTVDLEPQLGKVTIP
jgi:prepilin-type N-terminal cleavage/methylation domain-containing protein